MGNAKYTGRGVAFAVPSEPNSSSPNSVFHNQRPIVRYNAANNSQDAEGVITGKVRASDPDGDQLSIKVTQDPKHGIVVVRRDGTFTYTPDAVFAHKGGDDSFEVTVSDHRAGFHLHGLAGLLSPDGGHTRRKTVELRVAPVNHAPLAGNPGFTVKTVDPDTGVVTGLVHFTDSDGDKLGYSLGTADPANGSATVDPATGDWTYTPSLNARLKAPAVNAPTKQVSFTVNASDGRASTPVTVNADVTPVKITTIPVGPSPSEVRVSPNGAVAYVTV